MINDTITREDQRMWDSILDRARRTFGYSDAEIASLRENKLLRMFALLPSIADCPNPEGVGFLNTTVYLAERRGGRDLFVHKEADDRDPLNRLKPFEHLMTGGDPEIIRKGLLHAAIVMVNDYHTDQAEDKSAEKYNPIVQKRWDYSTMLKDLTEKANQIFCPRLSLVFSSEEAADRGFWIDGTD